MTVPVSVADEWRYWDGKVTDLRRGQTAALRTSATKWAALLTALLGAFSAVAFAGGLTRIDDLGGHWVGLVKWLTTVAAVASVGAIGTFSFVSGGLQVRHAKKPLTATELATDETNPTPSLIRLLLVGRGLAILAAGCVIVGSVVVLWAPQAPTPATPLLVRFSDGAVCGRPISGSDGTLKVAGRSLSRAKQVLTVTTCPALP
jgi:hypothetical protein